MELSISSVDDFAELFKGNDKAYGTFSVNDINTPEGQKVEGKAFTKEGTLGFDEYSSHLNGISRIGIIPIRQDGTCSFAAIDVDKYDSSYKSIVRAIYKYSLPLVPFRSKSGGLHLFMFLDVVTDAKRVIKVMNFYRKAFGLGKSTEIFPKQTSLTDGAKGNWINLPYFNAENTKQYLINSDFTPCPLDEAVVRIAEKKVTNDRLNSIMDELPLFDAPPCLQTIYMLGDTQERNQYLFSLARYYKAKDGDDFEFAVMKANNELDRPLPPTEITDTIIKAHKKKNYSYKCEQEPICSFCDKMECKSRKYGIGGAEVSNLSYEDFIQYGTEEPYYEWIINGTPLKFFNEADIINQNKFREQCFKKLHILPFKLTDFNWTETVNKALKNVIVKDDEEKAGMSLTPAQLFREYLVEFLTKRAVASNQEQVLIDRVYLDPKENGYIFKPKNLSTFLIHQKQFRAYGQQEINDKLKMMGCTTKNYYISSKKKQVRTWILPCESIANYVEEEESNVDIDFLDNIPEEGKGY